MLFPVASLSLFACLAAAASTKIQVNYYKDGGCSEYNVAIHPSTDESCYGYNYGGTNSANIASCNLSGSDEWCSCTFYADDNCKGLTHTVATGGPFTDNCASNWGHGWKSMRCGKTVD